MTLKILHSADWQLGMRFRFLADRSTQLENARFTALEKTIALAQERGVDAIIGAGDLFENNQVSTEIISRTAEILAAAPCPVYLLPGNHDPLGDYSVFHHACWRNHPTVTIFRTDEPIETQDAIFVPAPCRASFSDGDPTASWRRRWRDDRFFIGVAHGSLENQGFVVSPDDFPISPDVTTRVNYDYIALGHWHSSYVLPQPTDARLVYSGTPESTGWGERDSGNVLLVTIDRPGGSAQIESCRVGSYSWLERNCRLHDASDLTNLRQELETLMGLEQTLLSLRLDGTLDTAATNELAELLAVTETRLFFLRVENSIAHRSDDLTDLVARVPDGLCRAVGERLLAEIDRSTDDKQVAERALVRLAEICARIETQS